MSLRKIGVPPLKCFWTLSWFTYAMCSPGFQSLLLLCCSSSTLSRYRNRKWLLVSSSTECLTHDMYVGMLSILNVNTCHVCRNVKHSECLIHVMYVGMWSIQMFNTCHVCKNVSIRNCYTRQMMIITGGEPELCCRRHAKREGGVYAHLYALSVRKCPEWGEHVLCLCRKLWKRVCVK